MKRNIFYICIILGLFFALNFLIDIPPPKAHAKCPDDYLDTDAGSAEYIRDFDQWTNEFYDSHPNATLSDWSKARYQFWEDHNCIEAIKRYNETQNGTANPDQMKLIEKTIKQTYEQSK